MAFEEAAHVLGPQNIIVPIENGGNSLGKFIFIHRKYLKRTNEKNKKTKKKIGKPGTLFFFFLGLTSARGGADVSNEQDTRVAGRGSGRGAWAGRGTWAGRGAWI